MLDMRGINLRIFPNNWYAAREINRICLASERTSVLQDDLTCFYMFHNVGVEVLKFGEEDECQSGHVMGTSATPGPEAYASKFRLNGVLDFCLSHVLA